MCYAYKVIRHKATCVDNTSQLLCSECDHFADSFAPTFEMQGYKGVFAPKLGKQDGNATFWKDTTFSFVSHEVMSFNDHPSGLRT